jgi:hypothetical protein
MDKKYVLIKPFECQYGTLPEGSEIIWFRGQFYVNGGPVPPSFNDILVKVIKDKTYVKEMKIIKNEF